MTTEEFEWLVLKAIDGLPSEVVSELCNVDIVVQDNPSELQKISSGLNPSDKLFGLYEGTPITNRYDYNLVLPDKITLFRIPLEEAFTVPEDLLREIRVTVLHEIAHHFGFEDQELYGTGIQ